MYKSASVLIEMRVFFVCFKKMLIVPLNICILTAHACLHEISLVFALVL